MYKFLDFSQVKVVFCYLGMLHISLNDNAYFNLSFNKPVIKEYQRISNFVSLHCHVKK